MHFENLANELLLDLFEFFDAIHLLHAFDGLNFRFNTLLFIHFRSYHLNFRSITKQNFDIVCQQYIPSIFDRIISFHLSDDDETPNLPNIFLSHGFTLNQFIHLQSLSLYYIQSFDTLNQLILHCRHLPKFKHLNMIKCYFNYKEIDVHCLINNIWSLPNLTHCVLDQISTRKMRVTEILMISSSIEQLSLERIACTFEDLFHLFNYTPCLRRLSLNKMHDFLTQQLRTVIPSLISLKLVFHGCIDSMIILFQTMPNLCHLTLETVDIYCNGHEWKQILLDYLHNIKKIQLKMNLKFLCHKNIGKQVDQLLDSFRTPFWIEEHRWFVRCDWDPFSIFNDGILYTLPYTFDKCFYFDAVFSKSTCSNDADYWLYEHVQTLLHENPENDLSKDLILFSARFPNVCYLKISFPFQTDFWSCISSFNQLTSLTAILLYTDSTYIQLQNLFSRAIHLYSLKLSYFKDFPMTLFQMTSRSIRRLDFITKSKSHVRYFNNEECAILINSSLGRQCEVLLIGIENRINLIDLINKMFNLRSLIYQCRDDKSNDSSSPLTNDELVEWLKNNLPARYLISRDIKRTSLIRFWIG